MQGLFEQFALDGLALQHRVVMAPLSRMRAGEADIPGELMVEYYRQRASPGGLIIAEATVVSRNGRGYLGAPGIYADNQIAGWRKVTEAVHAKGGKILLQLWHVGRQSHRDLQPGGAAPVAPSAITYEGYVLTQQGWVPPSPARALELEEIADIVEDFRLGAERAQAAGFDGVEIHAGNGYLIAQFLQDGSNQRRDHYGGSIANRVRFALEVTAAVRSVWRSGPVGMRIAPGGTWGGMSDSDPQALYGHLAQQLNDYQLSYLHVIEPRMHMSEAIAAGLPVVAARQLRALFRNPIIAAGGFTPDSAARVIADGDADLVAFGRDFIATPDLPERIRLGLPLNAYQRDTFYGGDSRGYTDYPRHDQLVQAA